MSVTFKQLTEELVKWKDECGEKAVSKKHGIPYDKIDPRRRRETLPVLISRLKKLGADKKFFDLDRVQREIASSCNPPKKSIPKDTYRSRMRGTLNDLVWSVVRVYGTDEFPASPSENDSPSLAEKIRTEDLQEDQDEWTQAVSAPPKKIVAKREFDASRYKKEKLEDEPELKDVLDPEMAELLGFKK